MQGLATIMPAGGADDSPPIRSAYAQAMVAASGRSAQSLVREHVKVAANFIIALMALVGLVAMAISVYPGVLDDLLFIGVLLSFLGGPCTNRQHLYVYALHSAY